MDLNIDFMKEEDIDEVLNISSLSFAISWSKDSYIQELTNPIAKYLVAKIDNKAVAFIGTWIILDEAHKSSTSLSLKSLLDIEPSFILELTATPITKTQTAKEIYASNILYSVNATKLKKENMIKY